MNENATAVHNFLKKNLKSTRLRDSKVNYDSLVACAESDRGRVLYSAAFRRLQQKAQVFSLEPNAAVRSRLTHSLEVSQVGRYISDKIIEKSDVNDPEIARSLAIFVETACLAHDIGNPPFGHFGEAAIQEWFRKHGKSAIASSLSDPKNPNPENFKSDNSEILLKDFIEFDGNPQGLRIISKLQWNNDALGLNLTTTSLLSCIKYLRCAGGDLKPLDGILKNEEPVTDPLYKKAGYFISEEKLVKKLWEIHSIERENPCRFPLSAIMEAADDISYCISDLEDSVEKEIVSLYHASCWIKKEWEAKSSNISDDPLKEKINSLIVTISHEWGGRSFQKV